MQPSVAAKEKPPLHENVGVHIAVTTPFTPRHILACADDYNMEALKVCKDIIAQVEKDAGTPTSYTHTIYPHHTPHHKPTSYAHTIYPHCTSTPYIHIIHPHHIYPHYTSTPYIHIIHPRHTSTSYTHIICRHHLPTSSATPPAGPKWERYMPSWHDCGHRRGRLQWGATRDKHGNVQVKRWVENKLCRTPVTMAIRKYFETVGLPPAIAGESLVKAAKEGRFDLTASPSKLPRGQTRGQTLLVPCLAPNDIN